MAVAECRHRTSRVASHRLFFPSASANRDSLHVSRRPAFETHPASALGRSCGFGRHSSSPAADVIHAGDRGSEPIMRHRPHSRWRSAIGLRWSRLVDRPRAFFKAGRIDNAPGIVLTLRSFIPAPQVNPGCPGGSNPACRFMNVRPDVFYAGDRSPIWSILCNRSIKGRSFRLPGLASTLSASAPDD
jgi:hypothetical protein